MSDGQTPRSAVTVAGSIRTGSYNEILRRYVSLKLREAGVVVEDLDLRDYRLPIFDEDLEAEGTPEAADTLARKFAAADIVVIISPENNSGTTALIKNMVDWVSRQKHGQWRHAIWGIGAVSSGKYGGVVGIAHLRDTLSKLGALIVPTLLGVGPAEGAFDAEGVPTEEGIRRKVDQMVKELTHFSRGGIWVAYGLYVTHPQVAIDPDVPVPNWGLSAIGRSRAERFATHPLIGRARRIVSSRETKALELAAILSAAAGRGGGKRG